MYLLAALMLVCVDVMVCLLLCKEEGSSPVYLQLLRGGIYIITRKDCYIISDCTISDFISDHRVLYSSLQCILPHPV